MQSECPNGVVAEVMRANGNELAATALRLECLLDVDSFLATLGFGTKSLWDFLPRPRTDTLRLQHRRTRLGKIPEGLPRDGLVSEEINRPR